MKRNYLFTQHLKKHINVQKIISGILATVMLVILFAVPNLFVLAENETASNLIADTVPIEVYKASRNDYKTKVTSGALKFGNDTFPSNAKTSDEPFKTDLESLTDGNTNADLNITIYDGSKNFPNTDSSVLVMIYELNSNADISEIQLTSAKASAGYQVSGYDCFIGTSLEDLLDDSNRVFTSNGNKLTESGTAFDTDTSLTGNTVTVDLSGKTRLGKYAAIVITRPAPLDKSNNHIARMTEIAVYGTPAKEPVNLLSGKEPVKFYLSGSNDLYDEKEAGNLNVNTANPDLRFLTDGDDTYSTADGNKMALRFPSTYPSDGRYLVLVYDLGEEYDLSSMRMVSYSAGRVGAARLYAGNDLKTLFGNNNRVDTWADTDLESNIANQPLSGVYARYAAFVITKGAPTGQNQYNMARVSELSVYGVPLSAATHNVSVSTVDEYGQDFSDYVTVNLPASILDGSDMEFEVTPISEAYTVLSVRVNNIVVNPVDGKYTVENVSEEQKIVVTVHEDELNGKELRVLAIGNSYTQDSMEYLYKLAEDAGAENIVLGYLYIPGCTISQHWQYAKSNSASYTYYKTNANGTWSTTVNTAMKTAIKDEVWNVIVLQQGPAESGVASTYNSDLDNLIAYVNDNKIKSTAKIAWHMTWAYQSNCTVRDDFSIFGNNQMTMYNAIISAVQNKIVTNNRIDFVIPTGTAIQNMRTSFMGDTLTRDGYHLSLDCGRYTAAMTWLRALGWVVNDLEYIPSDDAIPESYLPAIKEAVNNAFAKPYEISESSYKVIHNVSASVVDEENKPIRHGATIHSLPASVTDGGRYSFSLSLFKGYSVVSVKVNNVPVTAGADGKYVVDNVISDQNIVITLVGDGTQAKPSLIADEVPLSYYLSVAGADADPSLLCQTAEDGKLNISNIGSHATETLMKKLTDGYNETINLYYRATDQQAGKCLVLIYDLHEVCKLSGIKFTGEAGSWRVGNVRMYAGLDLGTLLTDENRVDTLGDDELDTSGIAETVLADKEAAYVALVITKDVIKEQIDAKHQYNMARVKEIEVFGETTGKYTVSASASDDFEVVIPQTVVEKNATVTFTVNKKGCFAPGEVKVNGVAVTPTDGIYTVRGVTSNISITVTKGKIENNLIAGQPLTQYYAVMRNDYNTPLNMATIAVGDTDTALTDGSIGDDSKMRIQTAGNPDGYVTAGSKNIVLIYYLGGIADVKDIYFASTNESRYYVAGYDYFISESMDDLLNEKNLIWSSNGNKMLPDEDELDPSTSIVTRENNVHFDNAKRGRYVAIVITRPHSTTSLGYNMARISEISVCGDMVEKDIMPNMYFVDSATDISVTFSATAADIALKFGDIGVDSVKVQFLPLSDITRNVLTAGLYVPLSEALQIRLYDASGRLIPDSAFEDYNCMLSMPSVGTTYQFWNYIQDDVPILVNNSTIKGSAVVGDISGRIYSDFVVARFMNKPEYTALDIGPGVDLDYSDWQSSPQTGEDQTLLWLSIFLNILSLAVLSGSFYFTKRRKLS